jgi:hypothetical protein
MGGGIGTTITATTITDYITATSTAEIIFSGGATSTATITSVSVIPLTDATGDLTVYGNLKLGSPIQNIAGQNAITLGPTGNIGIGTTTPTAYLHLKAGTASDSTAPLKFTSGVNMSNVAAGVIEFTTDNYYASTTTGPTRKLIVLSTTGRATGQTAANTSVATYTLGATDASYEVSANVLITTSSAEAFTVTCSYTSEDNTARVFTLNFSILTGTLTTAITSAHGAVYEGIPMHIRCKASTAITIKTTGTFTGATYNCEGIIKQIA